MKIRKLHPIEHIRTRELYEEVFPEDDEKFVDYYYEWKTKDNIIFAAENEDGIQAMVHLNPFQMYLYGEVQKLHYIVAVATRERYRHQGLMRRLLAAAEEEMCQTGERLTFLMPASEQIYLPFGYRFFAQQRRGILLTEHDGCGKQDRGRERYVDKWDAGKENGDNSADTVCRPVREDEYEILAAFVNAELKKQFDLFVWRDASYYKRLCAEQKCQGGDVMVICHAGNAGEIIGTFCTAYDEPETEIYPVCSEEEQAAPVSAWNLREVVLSAEYFETADAALRSHLGSYGDDAFQVEGCQPQFKLEKETYVPLYMGKVPGEGIFEGIQKPVRIFLNEAV